MLQKLKMSVRMALAPVLYRYAPCGLVPDRLATYISGLLERRSMNLPVAEVGCHLGGTSILAYRALRRNGWKNSYTCFDTFGGFVPGQFQADEKLGTPSKLSAMFADNSSNLVRRILDQHGCPEIRLVKGDIATTPDDELKPLYSAVLLDMDLSEPTYVALKRFWPRIARGGIIFVDDCPEGGDWKARVGYRRFCAEFGVPERYEFGLGIAEKT